MIMKKLLPIALFLILMPLVSAEEICIDKIPPSAPSNLMITDSPYDADGNISLSWTAATDEPDCSGIDHYNIYRSNDGIGFVKIGESETTDFNDFSSLSEGTYYYRVTAVDKVKFLPHEGPAVEGSTIVGQAPTTTIATTTIVSHGGGGGGGGSGVTTTVQTTTVPTTTVIPQTTVSVATTTVETTVPTTVMTTIPQTLGLTGAFLAGLASVGYWLLLIAILIILLAVGFVGKIRDARKVNQIQFELVDIEDEKSSD
jgi:hypothetical protein